MLTTLPMSARRRLGLGLSALSLGLAACGGGGAPLATGDAAPAAAAEADPALAAAAENLPLLQPANQVVDFEVLDVSDGSIATLRDAVAGDRPVLLWFFSPH